MTHRLTWLSLLALGLMACTGGGSGGGTSSVQADEPVKSFAHVTPEGEILGVGVIVPVKSFESVPSDDDAFQGVGIEMPAEVRDRTFIQSLRINWLASGHGPSGCCPSSVWRSASLFALGQPMISHHCLRPRW